MAAILDIDLERSVLTELARRLDPEASKGAAGIAVDAPGVLFRVKARDRWIEPRLTRFVPTIQSLRGAPIEVEWTIRCYSKVEAKGERSLVLSEIVDEVRRVIDPLRGARPINIADCDGKRVGLLECDPPGETRAYNQRATIRGDSIPGLDVATLIVSCRLMAKVC